MKSFPASKTEGMFPFVSKSLMMAVFTADATFHV